MAAATMLLFPCKDINPCVFSFSFFLFLLSVLSSLSLCVSSLLSLFLYFFSFSPLFSFLSFRSPSAASLSSLFVSSLLFSFSLQTPLLFCLPSSALFPCIYRKNRGERGRGGPCAASPKTARGARPLCFFHAVVGHGSELRQVGAFGRRLFEFFQRKGERKAGEKKSSSSPSRASRGRRRPTMPFKTAPFGSFFNEQWMKRHHFGQNASFHLKGKGGKILSKSKSIFNLKFIQSSPKLQF